MLKKHTKGVLQMKVTIKNIKDYLEGNSNLLLDKLNLQPEWYKEQIAYRMLICRDCLSKGKCKECGCDVPGKLYVAKSCNKGERFPDLMSEQEWIIFKHKNGIK